MREEVGEEEAVVAGPESTKEEGIALQEENKEEGNALQEESQTLSQEKVENGGVDGGKGMWAGREIEEEVEKEGTSGEGVKGEGMKGEIEVAAARTDAMDIL